jgi:8-oxo-dGTP diphosphatase
VPFPTVVAAVIERGGSILIGQRKSAGAHPLKWEFPGGKVNPDESPEAAIIRELEEELGIRACLESEITRYQYRYPGKQPILLIFYLVRNFDEEPVNRAFQQIVWECPERLPEYDFLEGDLDFISTLITSRTDPGVR